jgi:hypothetical protein
MKERINCIHNNSVKRGYVDEAKYGDIIVLGIIWGC